MTKDQAWQEIATAARVKPSLVFFTWSAMQEKAA